MAKTKSSTPAPEPPTLGSAGRVRTFEQYDSSIPETVAPDIVELMGDELDREFGEVAGEEYANEDGEAEAGDEDADLAAAVAEQAGLEDADGETDADAEEADGEDEAGEPDPAQLFKVTVDGEELEVPLDELLKGYSRTADYTRKTQALASQRRDVEQYADATRVAAEAYAQRLELISRYMGQHLNPQQLHAIEQEYVQVRQTQQDHELQQHAARLAEERELLEAAVPEWKDSERAKAEKSQMLEYATRLGYTPQDLAQVADHRAILLLRKAMKYDELMGSRDKLNAKRKNAPVLKPGAPKVPGNSQRRAQKRAMSRLRQTGSVGDAAAALAGMLGDDF